MLNINSSDVQSSKQLSLVLLAKSSRKLFIQNVTDVFVAHDTIRKENKHSRQLLRLPPWRLTELQFCQLNLSNSNPLQGGPPFLSPGGGVLIVINTGRLRAKGVPFTGCRYQCNLVPRAISVFKLAGHCISSVYEREHILQLL